MNESLLNHLPAVLSSFARGVAINAYGGPMSAPEPPPADLAPPPPPPTLTPAPLPPPPLSLQGNLLIGMQAVAGAAASQTGSLALWGGDARLLSPCLAPFWPPQLSRFFFLADPVGSTRTGEREPDWLRRHQNMSKANVSKASRDRY